MALRECSSDQRWVLPYPEGGTVSGHGKRLRNLPVKRVSPIASEKIDGDPRVRIRFKDGTTITKLVS